VDNGEGIGNGAPSKRVGSIGKWESWELSRRLRLAHGWIV